METPVQTAVVIPTYNEIESIPALVALLKATDRELHVIIVDDNSPDGTGQAAEALRLTDSTVHVLHRAGKLGLGTAYLAGFHHALDLGCQRICSMDADFSHHPRYLPELVSLAETCDIAIGSRYVAGGGTVGWGVQRQILSRGANLVARTLLRLDAHDCTAGFRCYRREVLETLDLDSVKSSGYSFLVETLYMCQRAGFSVGEVPIIFEDRRQGQSKMSTDEIRRAIATVFRLAVTGRSGLHANATERVQRDMTS
jgi:dolichol-phosphate mannosyltransferase